MNISIDAVHTKTIHIKLALVRASIYLRLCYEKYVESSRQMKFKSSNTTSMYVPNLGTSPLFFCL